MKTNCSHLLLLISCEQATEAQKSSSPVSTQPPLAHTHKSFSLDTVSYKCNYTEREVSRLLSSLILPQIAALSVLPFLLKSLSRSRLIRGAQNYVEMVLLAVARVNWSVRAPFGACGNAGFTQSEPTPNSNQLFWIQEKFSSWVEVDSRVQGYSESLFALFAEVGLWSPVFVRPWTWPAGLLCVTSQRVVSTYFIKKNGAC